MFIGTMTLSDFRSSVALRSFVLAHRYHQPYFFFLALQVVKHGDDPQLDRCR